MVGAGKIRKELADGNEFTLFELGMSARYYATGRFARGLQMGSAVAYVSIRGDDLNGGTVSGVARGLLLAVFLGYKYTWSGGFTLEGQIGPSYLALQAKADNSDDSENLSRTDTYVNLNMGWSF